MIQSQFMLQIVFTDGEVYRFPAGGAAEINIEEALLKKVMEKEIGYLYSKQAVVKEVRSAFREMMYELKDQVVHPK